MNPVVTLKLQVHLVNESQYLDLDALKSIVAGINVVWGAARIQFALVDEPDSVVCREWPNLQVIATRFEPSLDGTIHGFYLFSATPELGLEG